MPLLSAILRAKGEAFTRSPLVEEAVATTSAGTETGASTTGSVGALVVSG